MSVDAKNLGKYLRILRMSDAMLFEVRSPIQNIGTTYTTDALVLGGTNGRFCFKTTEPEEENKFALDFWCESATNWPVEVDIRITLMESDEKHESGRGFLTLVENYVKTPWHNINDVVFTDAGEQQSFDCEIEDDALRYFIVELNEQ